MDPEWWLWLFHHWAVSSIGGSFVTAWFLERSGRDPQLGGLIGLIGGALGWFYLIPIWVWLLKNPTRIRVQNRRRRWYTWFRFW